MKNTKIKTGEWEPKANIQGQRWSNGMAIMCNAQRHMEDTDLWSYLSQPALITTCTERSEF